MLQQLDAACESEPSTTTYPYPSGVRDTRAYETPWADDAQGTGELPAGAEAAMQEQACANGLAACGDALAAAEAGVLARFPAGSTFFAEASARRSGGESLQRWTVMVTLPTGEHLCGFGDDLDQAQDDLRAVEAGKRAA